MVYFLCRNISLFIEHVAFYYYKPFSVVVLIIAHKLMVSNVLLFVIAIFPTTIPLNYIFTFLMPLDGPLEYKVNLGDSQNFTYTKFYDTRLTDPFTDLRYAIDINGSFQNFTVQTGTNFKITITNVTKDYIAGTNTIDDKVIIEEELINLFIRPMTNNLSLLAKSFSGSDSFEIKENEIIEQVNENTFYSEGIYYNLNRSRTSIWQKSGWMRYLLIRVYDAELVYYEMEIVKQSSQGKISSSNEITGILMLCFILIILGFLQFVSKRK